MSKSRTSLPGVEETQYAKRRRLAPETASQSSADCATVRLNNADCNLDFCIQQNGLEGFGLHEDEFAYCWSGARATVGITKGKYSFLCKVVRKQLVNMPGTPTEEQHGIRIGISPGNFLVENLGEDSHSHCLSGDAKFLMAGRNWNYGVEFTEGDTIVCSLDMDSQPTPSIQFSINGTWYESIFLCAGIERPHDGDTSLETRPWEYAFFPHVLLKNVVVQMSFSSDDELMCEGGFKPWVCAIEDGNAVKGPSFPNSEELEMIMMVGLPASGKTTRAEEFVGSNPDKRYVLLGTNLVFEQMKVDYLERLQSYGKSFDRIMDRATRISNRLLDRAAKVPHNYILDQANVNPMTRKEILKKFQKYRKSAVVMFSTIEELKCREDKWSEENGEHKLFKKIKRMLGLFDLPKTKDMYKSVESFDEVIFEKTDRENVQKGIDEMKLELKVADTKYSSLESEISNWSRPPMKKNQAFAAINKFGTNTRSPVQFPNHAFPNPPRKNKADLRPTHFRNPGMSCSTMPPTMVYSQYSEYARSSLHIDNSNLCRGYGVSGSGIPVSNEATYVMKRPMVQNTTPLEGFDPRFSRPYTVPNHGAYPVYPPESWCSPGQSHRYYMYLPVVPESACHWRRHHQYAYFDFPLYNERGFCDAATKRHSLHHYGP